ncbi:hypothetical protein AGMMS49940_10330 [Spirochaetia bacterium]|nr:hypothetical protein AGMMS49940_10330 [Spirochaetia bacterium]
MKTIEEYMNDPRILNDPFMEDGPIREIHAARLMLQDETAGMTIQEKCDCLNNKARESLVRHGITPEFVNLSGEGKIHLRAPVEA